MDQDYTQIGFAISVISIVIVLLVLLVVNLMLTSRNRSLMHKAELLKVEMQLREEINTIRLEVAEATLSDVSRDLHDETGQLLTFCILQLENISDASPDSKDQMLDEVKHSVRDALDVIRSISRGLSPDFVNQQGLVSSLHQLIDRAIRRTGRNIKLEVAPGFIMSEPTHAIIVFRIVRECLTNAIRHGNASKILVEIKSHDTKTHIRISDNGIGMSATTTPLNGQGFITMQHYAGLMHGELKIETMREGGTGILLTFPNIPLSN